MTRPPRADTIFHPTDFSVASQAAFAHALALALARRARLTLFHAAEGSDAGARWQDFPAVRETLERWGLLPEGSARADVASLGIRVEKISAGGPSIRRAIDEYLAAHPVQLVVMATEGRDGPPRWLRPSLAERVARIAGAPALFVPHGARGFVSGEDGSITLSNIVIPVDREPSPQPAVEAAASVARALQASCTLRLVFVGDTARMPSVRAPTGRGLRVERAVREGPVVEQIFDVIAGAGADLIAMTTRGHDGFLDALRGSTTEQILRRAPCPVLAVPEA